MQTVLLVIYLMIVVALIGVVLIQRSEGGGLGIGGGSGFMSARGTANALTRTTAILAALFFALALGMNVLSRFEGRPTDILNRIPSTSGQGNGILDSLGGQNGAAPAGSQTQPANNSGVPNSGAVAPQSQTTQPAPAATTQQAPAATGQQTAPATTTPAQSGNGVPTGN
ncbi:preprotein translocase subunit SecG [Rhizobium sp. ICMP 5592]|uniref:preprotein translocase subunit SecG n=1 Tax=Rhizobium sp. ICMP 5592 TaxID=2292445 RepID=UPI0012963550|nr:preprotein translocase subunit SecG [Rhizobium sp. ICMP 5592]MQB43005.1 preprotein translocase subunit SecG [Rhizobium sp. ICMP 5592]